MYIEIPQFTSWNCPEGRHSATCLDARITSEPKNGKLVQFLKLVFEIHVDTDENVQYLAKRNYELPMKHLSPLAQALTGWLGADFVRKNKTLDPSVLKGRKAVVGLGHIHNPKYPNPFVNIESISSSEEGDEAPNPSHVSNPIQFQLENIR